MNRLMSRDDALNLFKTISDRWRNVLGDILVEVLSQDAECSFFVLCMGKPLTVSQKELLIRGAAKVPFFAYHVLCDDKSLTSDQREILVKGASRCRDYCYYTLRSVMGLTDEQSRRLREKYNSRGDCA